MFCKTVLFGDFVQGHIADVLHVSNKVLTNLPNGFVCDFTAFVKDGFFTGEADLFGDITDGERSGNSIKCASDCTNKEHYAHDDAENKRECTFQNSHSLLLKSKRTLSCERAPRFNVL